MGRTRPASKLAGRDRDSAPREKSPLELERATMFKTRLILAACGILSWLVGTACGADSWSGCHVMPKSDKLVLRAEVDGPAAGDAYEIEWPATVERVEGQWLRITDRGGYSVPAVAGWVSSDDVLRLDAAHDHYVAAAMAADAPWLHWLTGVCLQTRGETRSARREFLQSLRLPADAAAAAARAAVGAQFEAPGRRTPPGGDGGRRGQDRARGGRCGRRHRGALRNGCANGRSPAAAAVGTCRGTAAGLPAEVVQQG